MLKSFGQFRTSQFMQLSLSDVFDDNSDVFDDDFVFLKAGIASIEVKVTMNKGSNFRDIHNLPLSRG